MSTAPWEPRRRGPGPGTWLSRHGAERKRGPEGPFSRSSVARSAALDPFRDAAAHVVTLLHDNRAATALAADHSTVSPIPIAAVAADHGGALAAVAVAVAVHTDTNSARPGAKLDLGGGGGGARYGEDEGKSELLHEDTLQREELVSRGS